MRRSAALRDFSLTASASSEARPYCCDGSSTAFSAHSFQAFTKSSWR